MRMLNSRKSRFTRSLNYTMPRGTVPSDLQSWLLGIHTLSPTKGIDRRK